MTGKITEPFKQLLATSTEIESRPFIQRPRTMAAIWGGMLACKIGTMALISPGLGAGLFAVTLVTGLVATYVRFGSVRDAVPGIPPAATPDRQNAVRQWADAS